MKDITAIREQVIKIAEENGWAASIIVDNGDDCTYEFSQFSPAGQDFSFDADMEDNDVYDFLGYEYNVEEDKDVTERRTEFDGEVIMMKRLTVRGPVTQRDIDRLMDLTNENQFGRNEAYYKLQHYENLEEEWLEKHNKDVVLIELDYKASYIRYALTFEEFLDEFQGRLLEDMPLPDRGANIYTIRPLVHVWYIQTTIGSPDWNEFFTDMSSGLPDSDINDGNLAYIEYDYMDKLVTDVRDTVKKYGKEN